MGKVLTHEEYIKLKGEWHKKQLRDRKLERHLVFGSQYNAFMSDADITILVGNRGSGKTSTLLFKSLKYIHTPNFNGYFLRKEVKDATGGGGIVEDSRKYYAQFGEFRESLQYLDWSFVVGSRISFFNYSAPVNQFKDKVQGKEIDDISVDEIAQMGEPHFNILMANLRNTKDDLRPQLWGACNPDADSWLKVLISPYLDLESEYHTHRPEMNGRKLYFMQTGNSVNDVVYGLTKEEVYDNAKDYIDKLVANSKIKDANPLDAILSINCFYVPRSENIHITQSKGGGLGLDARMSKMSKQEQIYAIFGGWKKVDSSESCAVSQSDLDRFFDNSEIRSGARYASMDISGKGKDKKYVVIWDGYHIEKIVTTDIKDAKGLIEWTKRTLYDNNVPISRYNFVYDSDGLGWAFSGHFTSDEAFAFVANAQSSEESKVDSYDDKRVRIYKRAKDEIVGKFISALTNHNGTGECGVSIDRELLNSTFFGRTIKNWIQGEVQGLEWKPDLNGMKQLITTKEMNARIGWHSDLLFAILYRFALDIGETERFEPAESSDYFDLMSFIF